MNLQTLGQQIQCRLVIGLVGNFQNFTGVNNTSADGAPKFYNCYTYINLPDMEGTITAISLIGSTADRYKYTTYTVENCYYLTVSASITALKIPSAGPRIRARGIVETAIFVTRMSSPAFRASASCIPTCDRGGAMKTE